MITQQQLQGNWNQLKGALQQRWGQLTDDDLSHVRGNVDQLVGVVQRKTGETRAKVEAFFQSALDNGSRSAEGAADQLRSYASDAGHAAQEQYAHAADALTESFEHAQDAVRRRPAESVAVCFGAGLIAGAVLGIMLRNRS